MKDSYRLNLNDLTINSENSVKLLGIEIDNKLLFEQHISALCSNASKCIGRTQKFMGFKEKEVLLNSFVYSNFNSCPLFDIFAHLNLYTKSKKYKNGHSDYYTTTSLVIILNS